MKKPASSSLEAHLPSKRRHATGHHHEWLSSYGEVVHYLLATYAPDDIIARVVKESESYKQGSGVSMALQAYRLYTKALRCGLVYRERRVKLLLVKCLDELVYDSMHVYLRQISRIPLIKLAKCADTLVKTEGRSVRPSSESS